VDESDLVKSVNLVLRQNGYLPKALEAASVRAELELEEYISRRLLSGASEKQILDELMQSLDDPLSRVFGGFPTQVKTAITGAVNIASTNGMVGEILSNQNGEEFKGDKYRWQSNGKNVCPDCAERHGRLETMETWTAVGLPAEFGSRCGANCQCMIVPEDTPDLSPILVGVGPVVQ